MQISISDEAIIQHRQSGDQFLIISDELDWELIGSEEDNMGERRHYAATVEHPELGTLVWNLWEYPLGVQESNFTDPNNHLVIKDFDYGLEHTPEEGEQREQLVAEIVEWFRGRYEDPAQRTSYESREGGYLWNHGGPFDARDEIEGHYQNLPEDIIEAAVSEIEADGTVEWAGGDWWDDENADYPEQDDSDGVFSINEPLPDISDFDFGEDDEDEYVPGDGDQDLDIPEQGAGVRFALSENGRIGLASPQLPSDDIAAVETVISELQAAANDLAALLAGSNTYPSLAEAAVRYAEAISSENWAIGLIYARGVRLENSFRRIELEISKGDLPALPPNTGEALDTVFALHGPMVLSTSEGRQLFDQSREFRRSDAETERYRAAAVRLVEAVVQAPNLFERDAANLLTALNDDIGTGPHPARTLQVAHGGNRNLLLVVGRLAGACVTGLVATAFAASEPGLLATGALTQAMNGAWAFLQTNAPILQEFVAASGGADMGWLSALLRRATSDHS